MKALIIGLGNIGLMYDINYREKNYCRTHSKSLFQIEFFKDVSVVDLSSYKLKIAKKEYGFNTYRKLSEGLKKTRPSFVVISSDTKNHLKNFNEIIKYYIPKIILIEKPISNNIDDIKKIFKICKIKKIKLFTNFIRRSEKSVINIKKNFLKGSYQGTVYYNKGFLNNGSHWINILEYFFGKVQKFKILKTKKKKLEKEINIKIFFKKNKINIIHKESTKIANYMNIQSKFNQINYLNGGKKIFIYDKKTNNKKTVENSMGMYQLNVIKEIVKVFKNRTYYNLCDQQEALSNFKTVFDIYLKH